ncbi:MAG: hypothetical protein J2P25_12930 [Nocardiopsaceae bacterium]|nr:hypothetical protein [Nocardiopsaceae bacterium]
MKGPNAIGQPGTGVLDVNTDDVWDAARAVAKCANAFGEDAESVMGTLAGTGNMAGTDLVATFFGGCYDPLAEQVSMAASDLVEALSGVALGLNTSANNFSAADHHSSVGHSGSPPAQSRPVVTGIPHRRPAPASGSAYLDLTGDPEGLIVHALARAELQSVVALFPTGHQDRLLAAASAWRQFAQDAQQLDSRLDSALDTITIAGNAQPALADRGVPDPGDTIRSWQDQMQAFVSRIWGSRPWLPQSGSNSAPLDIMGDCAASLGNACIDLASAIDITRSNLEHRMGGLAWGVLLEIIFSETGPLDAIIGGIFDGAMIGDCLKILYSDYWQPVKRLQGFLDANSQRTRLEAAVRTMPSLQAMDAQADSVADRALHDFQYPGLLASSTATKANKGISVPPGTTLPVDLSTLEGVDGAHTISRHVGLTEAQMRQRLDDQHVPAASTFTSEGAAQALVQDGINHDQQGIDNWLNTQSTGSKTLTYTPGGNMTTGLTMRSGSSTEQPAYSMRIILKRMPTLKPPFIVLTAYPD